MGITSLQTNAEIAARGVWHIPENPSLDNYIDVWNNTATPRYLINSFLVTIPATFFSILGGVLLSGTWHAGEVNILGVHQHLQNLVRDLLLVGMGLHTSVAMVTDGRFSGTNNGCFVGHVSPEAAAKGPIAAIQDGDIIEIDIPGKTLNIRLSAEEIQQRLDGLPDFEPKIKSGYLARYATMVSSADKGAVFPR